MNEDLISIFIIILSDYYINEMNSKNEPSENISRNIFLEIIDKIFLNINYIMVME
jgi:hypothetical protein